MRRPYRWTGIRAASRSEYLRRWRALRHNPDTAFHEGESPFGHVPETPRPTVGPSKNPNYRIDYARWYRQQKKRQEANNT